MKTEDIIWRPVLLLNSIEPDKTGESIIIDLTEPTNSNYIEINYITLRERVDKLVRNNEVIKKDDLLEDIKLLDKFSNKWKRTLLVTVFKRLIYVDDVIIRELTDPENIKEYNLEKYF